MVLLTVGTLHPGLPSPPAAHVDTLGVGGPGPLSDSLLGGEGHLGTVGLA